MLVRLKRTEEAVPEFERAVRSTRSARPISESRQGLRRAPALGRGGRVVRRAQQLQPAIGTTYELAKALHRKGTPPRRSPSSRR